MDIMSQELADDIFTTSTPENRPFSDKDYEWGEMKMPTWTYAKALVIPTIQSSFDQFSIASVLKTVEGRRWMKQSIASPHFAQHESILVDAFRVALMEHSKQRQRMIREEAKIANKAKLDELKKQRLQAKKEKDELKQAARLERQQAAREAKIERRRVQDLAKATKKQAREILRAQKREDKLRQTQAKRADRLASRRLAQMQKKNKKKNTPIKMESDEESAFSYSSSSSESESDEEQIHLPLKPPVLQRS